MCGSNARTESATKRWTLPECSRTSCFSREDISSLSISAASNSPSAAAGC